MKVYIAGPYTTGGPVENVDKAIAVAEDLYYKGHIPFIPHLYHYWNARFPGGYEKWMHMCIHWLLGCDALLRIPGESQGAEVEISVAKALGIPVFYTMADLTNYKGQSP